VLVIRNGWFSFRWTQIFDMGRIPSESIVLKARQIGSGAQAPFAPPPIDEVVAAIRNTKPDIVFAPHVETSSGMILPDDYLKAVGAAVRAVDGLFVLDCVASGTVWVDMVGNERRCADQRPAKRLERLAVLRLVASANARGPALTQRPAAASPATSRSGCRSWKPSKMAAMPTTRRCRPTHWRRARCHAGNRSLRLRAVCKPSNTNSAAGP
jgi:hypothetical protein